MGYIVSGPPLEIVADPNHLTYILNCDFGLELGTDRMLQVPTLRDQGRIRTCLDKSAGLAAGQLLLKGYCQTATRKQKRFPDPDKKERSCSP